jgi:hypothetical protein
MLVCPECGSKEVCVYEKHAIDANTFEHFCFSVKGHDPGAEAFCKDCDWRGERYHFREVLDVRIKHSREV